MNGWRNYNVWLYWNWKTKALPLYKSYFLEDANTDNISNSHKIYSRETNNKYFIGYLHDDYKTEPEKIILPKRACV